MAKMRRHRPRDCRPRDCRPHGRRRGRRGRAPDRGQPASAAASRRSGMGRPGDRARARPSRFVVRLGARVARFALLRAGRRHRAWVTFPEAGRWRYGVRIGTRDRFVGSVLVRPAVPRLQQPYGIVAQPGGALLVADYRSDAIIRLDPARGGAAIFARIPRPRDLRPAANGTLLVPSGRNVYELDPRTRALRVGVRAASRLEESRRRPAAASTSSRGSRRSSTSRPTDREPSSPTA